MIPHAPCAICNYFTRCLEYVNWLNVNICKSCADLPRFGEAFLYVGGIQQGCVGFGARVGAMIWYEMIWHDKIYDMIWYDILWYDMIYGIIMIMIPALASIYDICLSDNWPVHVWIPASPRNSLNPWECECSTFYIYIDRDVTARWICAWILLLILISKSVCLRCIK